MGAETLKSTSVLGTIFERRSVPYANLANVAYKLLALTLEQSLMGRPSSLQCK